MINIIDKKDCCGCYGCENVCPKKCITMIDDNEGFWYPEVNYAMCIKCGLCEKVCPLIQKIKKVDNMKFFAAKNKNIETRLESSSGGVFTCLSESVFDDNGLVFGAEYDRDLNVKYGFAKTVNEVSKFRGSKYVQSRMNDVYNQVKINLNNEKKVMFTGTPCHVAGLKKFLMKEYENLLLVDIACHGVPSPLVYKKYKKILSRKYNSEIKQIKFRDKINGWKNYKIKLNFSDKEILENANMNIYMKGFLRDLYLRPSCYFCKFKKPYTESDLTLADYWGVENIHPEFDDDKGVSLILVNSDKGEKAFSSILNQLDIVETDGDFAIKNNPCIVRAVGYNKNREKFFSEIDEIDLIENINKNIKISLSSKIKIKIFSILIRIKKMIK